MSDREIAELLARVCHDLRAPVRAMRAHAELFLRDGPGVDFAERLGFMVDGAATMDRMLDALSSYALALRTEPSSFQPTAMNVVVRTVLARLSKELSGAEVTYGDLPRVKGNPDRLMELLERVIRNSLEHRGPACPQIQVTATEQQGEWLIAVRDDGRERDFDPLSLAICQVIVERHGGRIWVDPSAVYFTLPA